MKAVIDLINRYFKSFVVYYYLEAQKSTFRFFVFYTINVIMVIICRFKKVKVLLYLVFTVINCMYRCMPVLEFFMKPQV